MLLVGFSLIIRGFIGVGGKRLYDYDYTTVPAQANQQ